MTTYRYTVHVIEGRDYTTPGTERVEYRGKDHAEALETAQLVAQKGDTRVSIVVEVAR